MNHHQKLSSLNTESSGHPCLIARIVKNCKPSLLLDTNRLKNDKGVLQTKGKPQRRRQANLIKKKKKQAKVRFSSTVHQINSVLPCDGEEDMYECSNTTTNNNTWYSAKERVALAQEGKQLVEEFKWTSQLASADPTSWSSRHGRIYQALCLRGKQQRSDKVLMAELEKTLLLLTPLDESLWGLERKAIPVIATDIQNRRQEIYAKVLDAQSAPDTSANKIRAASRRVSRPSVEYARCVAQLAAAADFR